MSPETFRRDKTMVEYTLEIDRCNNTSFPYTDTLSFFTHRRRSLHLVYLKPYHLISNRS